MKNLKKVIILSIIIISLIIYLIYNYTKDEEEIIQQDVYMNLDINSNVTEVNKIVLHIIGEVNNPRSNRS